MAEKMLAAAALTLAVAAAAQCLAPRAAFAEDAGVAVLQAVAEAPAGKASDAAVQVFTKKPCGSESDLFFCARVEQGPHVTENRYPPAFSTPSLTFKAPAAGTAVVTWQGTIYCEMQAYRRTRDVLTRTSYVVNLQIQSDKGTDPVLNGPGAASLGQSVNDVKPDDASYDFDLPKDFHLTPVTLTRTFPVKKGDDAKFFLRTKVEFRITVNGACNVNGGAMTAVFVKS